MCLYLLKRTQKQNMSCVYKCLIAKLKLKKVKPEKFMQMIKKYNKHTGDILWNGEELTKTQLQENYERIRCIKDYNNGYDCSACDPLLLLVCQLYDTSIEHNFNGTEIKYTNKKFPGKIIYIDSNKNHMFN